MTASTHTHTHAPTNNPWAHTASYLQDTGGLASLMPQLDAAASTREKKAFGAIYEPPRPKIAAEQFAARLLEIFEIKCDYHEVGGCEF